MPSNDGARISGWGTEKTAAGYVDAWYTLSGATGKLVQAMDLPACCVGPVLYDPVHARLYGSTTTADHHLRLTAYSAESGNQLSQLTVPDVIAGKEHSLDGCRRRWSGALCPLAR